ncbi:MAG: hypothetical protein WAT39_02945 [Planctomycetota bacterium]
MKTIHTLCAVTLGLAAVTAQCPFAGVAQQANGLGCNPVFGSPPTVAVALDTVNCLLNVTVAAFPGCCNTFLVGRMLVLGDQPAAVPLPWIGPGCTLFANPVILLYQPTAAGATFVLTLPTAALPPLTFWLQGGAHYFTTIGLTHDFALSNGSQITLQ